MTKLLFAIIVILGSPQIHGMQTQSTSSASATTPSVLSKKMDLNPVQANSAPITATQSVKILQKIDGDLVDTAVEAFLGKEMGAFFQEKLKSGDGESALRFIYIKHHLVELIPATMPYNCIENLHRALKESYEYLDKYKWRQAEAVFNSDDPNNYSIKELCDSPSIDENSHRVIVQRLTAHQFETNYFYTPEPHHVYKKNNRSLFLFLQEYKKLNHAAAKAAFLGKFLPRFAEKHQGWVSLIWVHPEKLNMLLNCSMEQLEFMVDLYHTQDPRMCKNTKKSIIFEHGSAHEQIFKSLPIDIQTNLKLNYPIIPTKQDRFFHNTLSFYHKHKDTIHFIAGTLAVIGSIYVYYKWLRKPLHNLLQK